MWTMAGGEERGPDSAARLRRLAALRALRQGRAGAGARATASLLFAALAPLLLAPFLAAGVAAVAVCAEPLDVSIVRQRVERRLGTVLSAPAAPETQPMAEAQRVAEVMAGLAAPARAEADAQASPVTPGPPLRLAAAAGRPLRLPGSEALEDLAYDLLRSDSLRYWFHTFLGRALDLARCDPAASGLQWIKAAYHARTERHVWRSAAGIERSLRRSRPGDDTRAVLCAYLPRGPYNSQQAVALLLGGLQCTPRTPR
jgi:hypothetical protein